MKLLKTVILATALTISLTVYAGMPGHDTNADQHAQMVSMMGDPAARSMMMDMVAADPQMRQEMMQKLHSAMNLDSGSMQHMEHNAEAAEHMSPCGNMNSTMDSHTEK